MRPRRLRVEEVFVECVEKTGLPGFGFSTGRHLHDSGAKDDSRREKLCLGESTGCILSDNGNPKWKSRIQRVYERDFIEG
jgi:hypothetical protein